VKEGGGGMMAEELLGGRAQIGTKRELDWNKEIAVPSTVSANNVRYFLVALSP
jgi:hypothetical protein